MESDIDIYEIQHTFLTMNYPTSVQFTQLLCYNGKHKVINWIHMQFGIIDFYLGDFWISLGGYLEYYQLMVRKQGFLCKTFSNHCLEHFEHATQALSNIVVSTGSYHRCTQSILG